MPLVSPQVFYLWHVSWDRNIQFITWHWLELYHQSIYTWLRGLLIPQSAVPILQAPVVASIQQRPIPQAAASSCMQGGIFLGPCLRPWNPVSSAETKQAYLGGTAGHFAPLAMSTAADTFLVLGWFCTSVSLCCFYSHSWHWFLQGGKTIPCLSSSVTDIAIKKSFSDKSIREYKSKHYMVAFHLQTLQKMWVSSCSNCTMSNSTSASMPEKNLS